LKLFRWNRCLKKLWLHIDRIHCHREITGKIRSKGTPTLLNLKEAGNLLDREDKRASRTFSILFSIENPSGAPSGNCPIVMVVKYKGSSMWDSNAPVQECKRQEDLSQLNTRKRRMHFITHKGKNVT
jgi:hypothetical protein